MYLINQFLFSGFPREVGIRSLEENTLILRKPVRTWAQVEKLIRKYNGLAHIYISVYSSNNVLDKIVFDVDSQDLHVSRTVVLELLDILKKEKLKYIVVFSGRKGFHVYVLFKRINVDESTLNVIIKNVFSYFVSQLDQSSRKYVDSKIVHSKALIRLPNTIHPVTMKWACPLPDIENMNVEDILKYASSPRDVSEEFLIGELKDIREYVDLSPHVLNHVIDVPSFTGLKLNDKVTDVDRYLQGLVRPCIAYHAHNPDADHFVRTALSIELSWLDIPPEEQVKIFSKLGWSDFNPRLSLYHATKIYEKVKAKTLFPPSCRTLKRMALCLGEACPFYPSVFYWWGVI